MQYRYSMLLALLALVVGLSGCAPAQPTEAMMENPTEAMMEKPTEAMMEEPTEAAIQAPAWFGVALTDVNRAETFAVRDFKGKVVLVETMAVWCSTCLGQQKEIAALHARLGTEMENDLVSLVLDIDPNETADDLEAHAASNGFDWLYAVAPVEVVRELASLYGAQYLNPPSAPMLVIDRQGGVHLLPFGIKSADDLYNAIQPFLAEGM